MLLLQGSRRGWSTRLIQVVRASRAGCIRRLRCRKPREWSSGANDRRTETKQRPLFFPFFLSLLVLSCLFSLVYHTLTLVPRACLGKISCSIVYIHLLKKRVRVNFYKNVQGAERPDVSTNRRRLPVGLRRELPLPRPLGPQHLGHSDCAGRRGGLRCGENAFFAPFYTATRTFAKTGSGPT